MFDTKCNINDNDSHSDKMINVPRTESIKDMKDQKKTLRYSAGVSQKVVWSIIGVLGLNPKKILKEKMILPVGREYLVEEQI